MRSIFRSGRKPLARPDFGSSSPSLIDTKRNRPSSPPRKLTARAARLRKFSLPIIATLAFGLAGTASLTGTTPGWSYLELEAIPSARNHSVASAVTEGNGIQIGVAGYCVGNTCQVLPFYSIPSGIIQGDDGSSARTVAVLLGLLGLVAIVGPLLWLTIWTRYLLLRRRQRRSNITLGTPKDQVCTISLVLLQARKLSRWLAWSCALISSVSCAGNWIWALSSSSNSGDDIGSETFSYKAGAYTAITSICLFFLWALLESAHKPTSHDGTTSPRHRRLQSVIARLHRLFTPRLELLTSSRTWSLFIGAYYLVVSLVTLVHDFKTPDVQSFIHAKYITQPWQSLPKPASFQGDAECAYFRGTSMVNQGTDIEPWFWFTGHHIIIILLSGGLMIDEWTNRRMGGLGPQQNKGGAAWTGIYLFTSVFSRCLAHGSKAQVEFTYLLGWLCLGISILNMVHSMCSFGWRVELRSREERQEQMEEQKEEYVTDAKSRPLVPFVKLACKVNEAITDIQEAAQLVRMSTSEDSDFDQSEVHDAKSRWKQNMLAFSLVRGLPSQVQRRRFKSRSMINNKTGKEESEEGAWSAFDPWHDGRRAAAVLMGLVMAIIQLMLICANVSMDSSWNMSQQYIQAQQEWKGISMWGPGSLTDICAFYNTTAIPIHPSTGADPLLQANTSVAIYFFNRAFLMMMSLCVMTVALSNQRSWGQTLPGCFSLIGPRNSSFSIGYTLIHISLATLSSAIFPTNAIGYQFTRFSSYFSLVIGVSFYLVSEDYSIQVDKPEPLEGYEADRDPYGPRMPFLRGAVRTENRLDYGDAQ